MQPNQKHRRAASAVGQRKGIDHATPRSMLETPAELLDDYLTAEQLIAQLGITLETLKRWNRLAVGPPFVHVGRQRLYNRESARTWLRSREQKSSVVMPD